MAKAGGLIALLVMAVWILQPSPLSDVVLAESAGHGAAPSMPDVATVAPAVPLRIALPAVGVDVSLYPGGIDTDAAGRLNPPDDRPAWWVRTAMPSALNESAGTTMILGHNLGDGMTPFSHLDRLRPGEEIVIWTSTGEIYYDVDEVVPIGRRALPDDERLMADVPGRLLLVTCRTAGGVATADNVVVVAHQVGPTV